MWPEPPAPEAEIVVVDVSPSLRELKVAHIGLLSNRLFCAAHASSESSPSYDSNERAGIDFVDFGDRPRNLPMNSPRLPEVEIKSRNGRPTLFVDGAPRAMPTYSPTGWRPDNFERTTPWFCDVGMGIYFVSYSRPIGAEKWGEQLFWRGDAIAEEPLWKTRYNIDEQVAFIRERDPDAYFLVRNGGFHCPSWRELHPEEMFVGGDGKPADFPSMGSAVWVDRVVEHGQALVRWCERQPWAERLLGHWYGWEVEGTPEHTMTHRLFDYSPVMQRRFSRFLQAKYGDEKALAQAWKRQGASFADRLVPEEKLFGDFESVRNLLYWQAAEDNAPLRDYLLCLVECYHVAFRRVAKALAEASQGRQLFLFDCMKTTMTGWSNFGFFNPDYNWNPCYNEALAASGHMRIGELLDLPELGGIITPHDYQNRGVGGVFEPEGCVDSCVLRNKYFFAEGDVRTYQGDAENGAYGTARDQREFAAINWRNFATAHTRGFNYYWMDLAGDWFGNPDIQAAIRRTAAVQREALDWPREEVPGIAMILDDQAALETNGSGNVAAELVGEEWRGGLAHCGVPYRIYLFEDLALDTFPQHRLFYFPNLHRIDAERLALLRRTVMRDGNVIVWGPGSGVSDGQTLSPEHASRLTGFDFDWLPVNHPRRVRIVNFDHPITRGLTADFGYGSPLAYGPLLHPRGGVELGLARTKAGRNEAGLAVKCMGDWQSVFTFAGPLPAALWRNLARFSGTHVYCETNDVLLADSTLVALHSSQSGRKRLALPGRFRVRDLATGEYVAECADTIDVVLNAPETRVFRLEPAGEK